jgi:uncharacterized protein YdcH (DUF465 family)
LCASHSDALAALAAEWREILDAARASWLSDRSALEQELATVKETVRSSSERHSEAASAVRAEVMSCHMAEVEESRQARHRLERDLAVAREQALSAVATCKSELLSAHARELREQSARLESTHCAEIARLRASAQALETTNAELVNRLPGGSQKLGKIGEEWVKDLLLCTAPHWVVDQTGDKAREMDFQVHGVCPVAGCDDFSCRVEVKHSDRVKIADLTKFERDIAVLIEQDKLNSAVLVNIGGTIDHHTSGEVSYRIRPDGLRIPILFLQKEGTSPDVFIHAFRHLECLQRDCCAQFRFASSTGADLNRLMDETRHLREVFASHGRSIDRRIATVTASIRGQQSELSELRKQKQQVQQALSPHGPTSVPVSAAADAPHPAATEEPGGSDAATAMASPGEPCASADPDICSPDGAIGEHEPGADAAPGAPAAPATMQESGGQNMAERAVAAWQRFERANNRQPKTLGEFEGVDLLIMKQAGFGRIRDWVRHSKG